MRPLFVIIRLKPQPSVCMGVCVCVGGGSFGSRSRRIQLRGFCGRIRTSLTRASKRLGQTHDVIRTGSEPNRCQTLSFLLGRQALDTNVAVIFSTIKFTPLPRICVTENVFDVFLRNMTT